LRQQQKDQDQRHSFHFASILAPKSTKLAGRME
jgi:hypothetical protein